MQITFFILPWIINLAHQRQGSLVEYRTAPGVFFIPAVKMQLYFTIIADLATSIVAIYGTHWSPIISCTDNHSIFHDNRPHSFFETCCSLL